MDVRQYLLVRLLLFIVVVIGAVSLIFFLLRVLPGDPARLLMGDYEIGLSDDQIEHVRDMLGLDEPIYKQYLIYMQSFVRGDFGRSFRTRRPVSESIRSAIIPTLMLTSSGIVIALIMGVTVGIFAALHRDTWLDYLATIMTLVSLSSPSFWFALILVFVFSYLLRWFPIYGAGIGTGFLSVLHHLALPALAIGARQAGLIARMTRSCMLEILGTDYIRTARAKGLHGSKVLFKHGLRNAGIPLITIVGLITVNIIGGAVIIESVFARPGLGKLIVDAMFARDYPTVQGVTAVFAIFVILANFIVDVSYGFIDPRVKYD